MLIKRTIRLLSMLFQQISTKQFSADVDVIWFLLQVYINLNINIETVFVFII